MSYSYSFLQCFFHVGATIMHKVFQGGPSFYVGWGTTGNVHFLFYGGALLVGWALGYNCVKFWDFHGIS